MNRMPAIPVVAPALVVAVICSPKTYTVSLPGLSAASKSMERRIGSRPRELLART
jgi:hypothetical protein